MLWFFVPHGARRKEIGIYAAVQACEVSCDEITNSVSTWSMGIEKDARTLFASLDGDLGDYYFGGKFLAHCFCRRWVGARALAPFISSAAASVTTEPANVLSIKML